MDETLIVLKHILRERKAEVEGRIEACLLIIFI